MRAGITNGNITVFAYSVPKITAFKAERYVMDDDTPVKKATGENVMITAKADVASVNGANSYDVKIVYNVDGEENTATTPAFASGTDGGKVDVVESTTALTGSISAAERWRLVLTVTDRFSTVTATVYVEKAKAYFAVTPEGVSVGGFTEMGSTADPTFESVYPAHFKNGIYDANGMQIDYDSGWTELTLEDDVSVHTSTFAVTPQYRRIGNHVYIKGHINTSVPSGGRLIATLPEGFRPSSGTHYDIAECAGQRIGRIYANADGVLKCEWVYTIGGSAYTSALWIQIDMDFLVD